MGFLSSIFGGGQEDAPAPEPIAPIEETQVLDPNKDDEMSAASKQRQQILAKRGRSSLVTSRADGATRSGVSVG